MLTRKNLIKFLVIFAALAGLIFFSESPINKRAREIIGAPFRGMMAGARIVARAVGLTSSGLPDEEAVLLIRENQRMKAGLFELGKFRSENKSLKKALGLKEESGIPLQKSGVIFYTKEFGKEFMLIDKGVDSGIQIGDPVLDEEMIFIGMVRETGDSFSKIEIASNPGMVFEVKVLPSGVLALARGRGARTFKLELIPVDTSLRRGDLISVESPKSNEVESSGVSVLSRYSFLLGEIVWEGTGANSVFREAGAVLLARPEFLQEVWVIKVQSRR